MVRMKSYKIRKMTKQEVQGIAIEWAALEGWNPGIKDADCFYETDPKGFYVGLLDNKPISCISVVKYPNNFAFLGFYIVKKEFRGKGYGLELWERAIKDLQDYNIGLDGVIDQQENYKKSGFKLAYSNVRYEGRSIVSNNDFNNIIPIKDININALIDYDSQYFPVRREKFIKSWIEQYGKNAFASVDEGKINGYAVIRECRNGYKIGPLFAENAEIAESLFIRLNNTLEKEITIYLDIPEINIKANALVQKYGMKEVFGTARMYTKEEPNIDQNKVFGVTTFELG
jgi:ribosomal protein S18 acetylase RimI-like enzyme